MDRKNSNTKRKIKKLADVIKQCCISEQAKESPRGTVINQAEDPVLVAKWPKLRMKVPPLFLHTHCLFRPGSFEKHALKLVQSGVNFYRPIITKYVIKINFPTFADQRSMAQYFDKNELPYHTYGHPSKRKLKVVIRGLPDDTDLNVVREELKVMKIPVVRVHKMKNKAGSTRPILILAVVPHAEDGRRIFLLRKILGSEVTLEPPKEKLRQCHRCQLWGHSQRYCHGAIKCVKCAGDHFSKKCTRDPEKEPPKCANCYSEHTANFTGCHACPQSAAHKNTRAPKIIKERLQGSVTPEKPILVTVENLDQRLYRNYSPRPRTPSDVDEIDYDAIFGYDDDGEFCF